MRKTVGLSHKRSVIMYSGTTIRTKSGRVMGVHQKIDRVARRHLTRHLTRGAYFPRITEILHFEGTHGPDGIKRKSPGRDEPWHYINPAETKNAPLVTMIEHHIENLAQALQNDAHERASFEAAWLAHAITDGLTPAHHYPLEEKITELRGGKGLETRTTVRQKIMMGGATRRQMLENNWKYWGAKGVFTTHFMFEWGVATAVSTMKFDTFSLSNELKTELIKQGFVPLYHQAISDVHAMGMYEEFQAKGWTRNLAKETKNVLVPSIIRMVMLGWLEAVWRAEKKR